MAGDSMPDLHRELRSRQSRLGTASEMPDDFDRVLWIAHQLSNEVTAQYLRAVAEDPADSPRSLLAICRDWMRS